MVDIGHQSENNSLRASIASINETLDKMQKWMKSKDEEQSHLLYSKGRSEHQEDLAKASRIDTVKEDNLENLQKKLQSEAECCVPRFEGADVQKWIIKTEEHFRSNQTPAKNMIQMAKEKLTGETRKWFISYIFSRNAGIALTWTEFKRAIQNRYNPIQSENTLTESRANEKVSEIYAGFESERFESDLNQQLFRVENLNKQVELVSDFLRADESDLLTMELNIQQKGVKIVMHKLNLNLELQLKTIDILRCSEDEYINETKPTKVKCTYQGDLIEVESQTIISVQKFFQVRHRHRIKMGNAQRTRPIDIVDHLLSLVKFQQGWQILTRKNRRRKVYLRLLEKEIKSRRRRSSKKKKKTVKMLSTFLCSFTLIQPTINRYSQGLRLQKLSFSRPGLPYFTRRQSQAVVVKTASRVDRFSKTDIFVSPSILSANFAKLGEQVKAVELAGCDWIHVDVRDGQFVSNITTRPLVVDTLRPATDLSLNIHLMIVADQREPDFMKAGADIVSVHWEQSSTIHWYRAVNHIRSLGAKAEVVLNSVTPLSTMEHILNVVDLILIMLVNPDFGGQSFIESQVKKILNLRRLCAEKGGNPWIEVYGRVDLTNAYNFIEAEQMFGGCFNCVWN